MAEKPVVHIAGQPVLVGTLARQMCAFCGAPIESKNMRHISYLGPDVRTPEAGFNHFPIKAFVEVRDNGAGVVGYFGKDDLPAGFCGESDLAAAVAEEAIGNG